MTDMYAVPFLSGLFVIASTAFVACDESGTGPGDGVGSARPAEIAIISGDRQEGTVGSALSEALVVEVADVTGRPVEGATVKWTAAVGAGSVEPASAMTDGNGRASAEWTLGTRAGEQEITAKLGTATSAAFTATAVVGPPATIDIASDVISFDAVGDSMEVSATAADRYGNVIDSPVLSWASSDTTVAVVTARGTITSRGQGDASITATADTARGSVSVRVRQVPARVAISGSVNHFDVGETAKFAARVFDANGVPAADADITWHSSNAAVATVDMTGSANGIAAGEARIIASVSQVADTAAIGVLGAESLLSTAFSGTASMTEAAAGEAITVPVVLDMSRVSAVGDLGSAEFELRFDESVLVIDSFQVVLSGGTAATNVPGPGIFSFAFAGTGAQGTDTFTLLRAFFTLARHVSAGSEHVIRLVYTDAPAATDFKDYSLPVTLDLQVRVLP